MDADEFADVLATFTMLLDRHCPKGDGFEGIGICDSALWNRLEQDGWLDCGTAEGGNLPLEGLARLAMEWGRHLAPLPFTPTMLGRRWRLSENGMVAFALPTMSGILVPYGGEGVTGDVAAIDLEPDSFDLSCTILRGEGCATLTMQQASELQLLLVCEAIGAGEENFERAAAYSQERVAYGRPISAFQAMRHRMANMLRDLELAKSAILWASSNAGDVRQRAIRLAAKLAQGVCADCVQVFGGIGHTWELGTHRFLRHAMAMREIAQLDCSDGTSSDREDDDKAAAAFRQQIKRWAPQAVRRAHEKAGDPNAPGFAERLCRAWNEQMVADGYAALAWPVEFGGAGAPLAHVAIFGEECARAHAPADINRIGTNIAGPALMHAGAEAQKARFLPAIAQGREIWCEGFSEPNAGSDLANVSTRAHWDGEKYVINGSKIWTSFAHEADRVYLLVKTSDTAPRHKNLSVLLVDMRQPGIEVRSIRQSNGHAEFNEVFFTDAVAEADELLGEINEGWPLATIGAQGVRSMDTGGTTWHWYVGIATMLDRIEAEKARRADYSVSAVSDFRDRLDLILWQIIRMARLKSGAAYLGDAKAPSQITKLHWAELYQEVAEFGLSHAPAETLDYWREAFLSARAVTLFGGSVELQRNVIADHYLQLRKR